MGSSNIPICLPAQQLAGCLWGAALPLLETTGCCPVSQQLCTQSPPPLQQPGPWGGSRSNSHESSFAPASKCIWKMYEPVSHRIMKSFTANITVSHNHLSCRVICFWSWMHTTKDLCVLSLLSPLTLVTSLHIAALSIGTLCGCEIFVAGIAGCWPFQPARGSSVSISAGTTVISWQVMQQILYCCLVPCSSGAIIEMVRLTTSPTIDWGVHHWHAHCLCTAISAWLWGNRWCLQCNTRSFLQNNLEQHGRQEQQNTSQHYERTFLHYAKNRNLDNKVDSLNLVLCSCPHLEHFRIPPKCAWQKIPWAKLCKKHWSDVLGKPGCRRPV